METLYNVGIFIPFSVCVIWFIMGLLKWRKTFRTWMSNLLLAHASLYLFATNGFMVTSPQIDMFYAYDLICVFSGLSIVPCLWVYLLSLKGLRINSMMRSAIVVTILTITATLGILFFLLGPDDLRQASLFWLYGTPYDFENPDVVRITYFLMTYLYRILLVFELVVFFVYIFWNAGGLKKFFKVYSDYLIHKETVTIYNAQLVMIFNLLLVFLFRACTPDIFLMHHHLINFIYSCVLGAVIAIICYTTLFNDVKEISIIDFFCPVVPISAIDDVPEAFSPAAEPVLMNSDNAFGLKVNRNEEFAFTPLPDNILLPLQESFKAYVEDGKKYLEKGITLSRISEDIHSNKNYVSRMVHMTYGMTFPEYLNKKRVEYAKSVLLDDPEIKQEILADECGFANASAFNRAFKRDTDCTPRMWLVEQKKVEPQESQQPLQ